MSSESDSKVISPLVKAPAASSAPNIIMDEGDSLRLRRVSPVSQTVTTSDISAAEASELKGKQRAPLLAREESKPFASATVDEVPDTLVVYTPGGSAYIALRAIEDGSDPLERLPEPPAPQVSDEQRRAEEELAAFFPFFLPHDFQAEQVFDEMIYDRRRRVLLILVPVDLLLLAFTRCSGCSMIPWILMMICDMLGCASLVLESKQLLTIYVLMQALFSTPYIALTNDNPALLLFRMVVLLLTVQLRFTMPDREAAIAAIMQEGEDPANLDGAAPPRQSDEENALSLSVQLAPLSPPALPVLPVAPRLT